MSTYDIFALLIRRSAGESSIYSILGESDELDTASEHILLGWRHLNESLVSFMLSSLLVGLALHDLLRKISWYCTALNEMTRCTLKPRKPTVTSSGGTRAECYIAERVQLRVL